jgi:hypothetical protein
LMRPFGNGNDLGIGWPLVALKARCTLDKSGLGATQAF